MKLIASLLMPIREDCLPPRALKLYRRVMPAEWQSFLQRDRQSRRSFRLFSDVLREVSRFLFDVCWTVLLSVALLLLLYLTNDGRFRLGAVQMMLVGITVYHVIFKQKAQRVFGAIAILIQACFLRLARLLFLPARLVWKWTFRPRLWMSKCMVRICKFIRRRMKRFVQKLFIHSKDKKESEVSSDRISMLRSQTSVKNIFIMGKGSHES